MKSVLFAAVIALVLSGCASKSTQEFGTDRPKLVWDADGHAWIVRHNLVDTFMLDRVPEADRPIHDQAR